MPEKYRKRSGNNVTKFTEYDSVDALGELYPLVGNETKNRTYLLKHKISLKNSLFDTAPDSSSQTQKSNKAFWHLNQIFCAEFIRMVAPVCIPKHRFFFSPENKPMTGSVFMDKFETWNSCYRYSPETNQATLYEHPIDEQGCVIKDGKRKPIFGLGVCGTLRYLLGLWDFGSSNFGIIECDDYYLCVLIDLEGCLSKLSYSGHSAEYNVLKILNTIKDVTNYQERLKIPFKFTDLRSVFLSYIFTLYQREEAFLLSPDLINTDYIKEEVSYTLMHLINFLQPPHAQKLEALAAHWFHGFPLERSAILQELKARIETFVFLGRHGRYMTPRLAPHPFIKKLFDL